MIARSLESELVIDNVIECCQRNGISQEALFSALMTLICSHMRASKETSSMIFDKETGELLVSVNLYT